ncbi:hypothetical protein [Pollutibacter soli]|uniref:hypothetical protein n=1 Tax=Pollutibacter soli TaxID=3034157 RepID=UPI003013C325
MKKHSGSVLVTIIATILTSIAFTSSAQTIAEQQQLLVRRPWHIIQDKMTGIGRHKSMNENSKITFTDSGTWICTDPIENEKEGTWWIKETGILYMKPGKNGSPIKCEILILNEDALRFKFKALTSVRTMEWESDE